jgi:dipeptidyl aminopeptidase/acylaminoacyl peptidase
MSAIRLPVALNLRPVLLTLTALLAAGNAAPSSLEDYGRLPSLEDAAISPDGSRLAYVRTVGEEHILAVVSLADRRPLGALKIGTQRLRSIQWADDNRVLIRTSMVYAPVVTTKMQGLQGQQVTPSAMDPSGGGKSASASSAGLGIPVISTGRDVSIRRDWSLLQVYDLTTHASTSLPDPSKLRGVKLMNVIAGQPTVWRLDGHCVIFVPGIYVTDPATGEFYDESNVLRPALIRVDLDTGAETLLRQGSKDTQEWLTDSSGEVVAEEAYSEDTLGKKQRWTLKILRNGRFDEAASGHEPIDYPRLLGFGPTPDTLLMQAVDGNETIWKLLSLKDATFGPPMAEGRELSNPVEQRGTHRIVGGVQVRDDWQYVFFDPGAREQWDALIRAFDGAHVRLISASDDFKQVVVRVEGPRVGFKYELVDVGTRKTSPIGNVYQGVEQPLPVRRITYAAADGLQIPAYLTLPRERDPKKLPLIVLPHSVVTAVDTVDFDWWSQALAEQGYAVLRPNFRGSEVDRKFMAAGFGEWGRKMQTDLSDGVRYLVQEGIVDPKRVCIVGAGYGGYAALAGITLDPGVYRCAISVDGVSDLSRWQKWVADNESGGSSPGQRGWQRFLGVSGSGDPALSAISPIKHIDAVHVPVLLMHGQGDNAVPFEQSQMMFDALRRAGKDAELIPLKHEDDLFSSGEDRLLALQKSIDFLHAHNPPD